MSAERFAHWASFAHGEGAGGVGLGQAREKTAAYAQGIQMGVQRELRK